MKDLKIEVTIGKSVFVIIEVNTDSVVLMHRDTMWTTLVPFSRFAKACLAINLDPSIID